MEKQFRELLKKIKNYNDAVGVLAWDLRTGAPKKGVSERAEIIGTLSTEAFKMSVSKEMEDCLLQLEMHENFKELDHIMQSAVRECRKEFDRSKKIPEAMYREYVVLTSEAESVWEEAKDKNDFDKFCPYLEKIVDFNKKFIEFWGYKDNKYNTLLDYYEPGMTVEKLDRLFDGLRQRIVPLLARINKADYKPDTSIFYKYFEPAKQERFGKYILDKMGFDFEAGRVDESEHPFTTGFNPGDVRITTHYYPNEFRSALFSSIHEGGHALYEQDIDPALNGTLLCTGTSMGIHESQSRFWENIIGRSKEFWDCFFDDLLKEFPEEFKNVKLDDFYKAINSVEASLIRVEADELTYNLHIMIRYEIEKALINDNIKVCDLPSIWNEKMEEYLGIVPPDDAQGVLQDIHWAGGAFGYFPSYTLGNIYAAQLLNTIKKEIPDFGEIVKKGELVKIKEWLKEKIHRHGRLLAPSEILMKVTGEELNAGYLIEYMEKKYTEIYNL